MRRLKRLFEKQRKKAVLIAGPDHRDRYCATHLVEIHDVYKNLLGMGFKPRDIFPLVGRNTARMASTLFPRNLSVTSQDSYNEALVNCGGSDTLVVYIAAHGNAKEDERKVQSYALIGDDGLRLNQEDLRQSMDSLDNEQQLLATACCLDVGFSSLSNDRRTVYTSTDELLEMGFPSPSLLFFGGLREGLTMREAYEKSKANLSKKPFPRLMGDSLTLDGRLN